MHDIMRRAFGSRLLPIFLASMGGVSSCYLSDIICVIALFGSRYLNSL